MKPTKLSEVIALMTMGYGEKKGTKGRWSNLYINAVWAIWKSYLAWSRDEKQAAITPRSMQLIYHSLLENQYYTERQAASDPTVKGIAKRQGIFKACWTKTPWEIPLSKELFFLKALKPAE